jgi:hypothetical protein
MTSSGDLAVEPVIESGDTKAPQFADVHAADLAVSGQALQGLGMNLEQGGSFIRVKLDVFRALSTDFRALSTEELELSLAPGERVA